MKTVLIIAGYDPSGGAGVLADIKAVAAMGCYGAAAITSITFQNTQGVFGAEHQTASTLVAQLDPLFDDLEIHAVKTGMLPSAGTIAATAEAIVRCGPVPVVVDPVVRSTSGFDLIDDNALRVLVDHLFPLAAVVTPNIAEAERITGLSIRDEAGMVDAAHALVALGPKAALVKGGHITLDGHAVDILVHAGGVTRYDREFIQSTNTHGTGCTLASAIASALAVGQPLPLAVATAKDYVTAAIQSAPGIGRGHGPLNHFPKDPV